MHAVKRSISPMHPSTVLKIGPGTKEGVSMAEQIDSNVPC